MREVHAGDVIARPRMAVTVGHAAHVQPHLECLAFRLDSDEGSVCYSGDSGLCDEIVELARGCDVLIQMNHHFSGHRAVGRATARRAATTGTTPASRAEAGVKTLVLTHLLAQIDRPGVREQIVHEIRQEFDGRVIWGEDLMTIHITRLKRGRNARRTSLPRPGDLGAASPRRT